MQNAKEDTNVLDSLLSCQDDVVAGLDDLVKVTNPLKEAVVDSGIPSKIAKVLVVENTEEVFLPSLTVCLVDYQSKFNVLSTVHPPRILKFWPLTTIR